MSFVKGWPVVILPFLLIISEVSLVLHWICLLLHILAPSLSVWSLVFQKALTPIACLSFSSVSCGLLFLPSAFTLACHQILRANRQLVRVCFYSWTYVCLEGWSEDCQMIPRHAFSCYCWFKKDGLIYVYSIAIYMSAMLNHKSQFSLLLMNIEMIRMTVTEHAVAHWTLMIW